MNARGDPIGHRLEIDETRAAVVRRIFDAFGAGDSCQRIAADLNAEGVGRLPHKIRGCVHRAAGREGTERAGRIDVDIASGNR